MHCLKLLKGEAFEVPRGLAGRAAVPTLQDAAQGDKAAPSAGCAAGDVERHTEASDVAHSTVIEA